MRSEADARSVLLYYLLKRLNRCHPPSSPPFPTGEASQRARMREILHIMERTHPRAKNTLRLAVERCTAAEEKEG